MGRDGRQRGSQARRGHMTAQIRLTAKTRPHSTETTFDGESGHVESTRGGIILLRGDDDRRSSER